MPGTAQGFVPSDRGRAVLFPRPPVLVDPDDRRGLADDDGGVATAGVVGAAGCHRADLLTLGDLVEQLRQDRAVAIAARGKLHGPDVRSRGVHGQVHLAPLASSLNTVFARLPFAIVEELDACAVHQQVQQPFGAPIRNLDRQCLLTQGGLVGHRPVQVRHLERASHHPGGLPQRQLELQLDR